MSLTVLIDYDSGNLHSAAKAFARMATERGAGEVIISADPHDIARADRIVLPGDGAFPACKAALMAKSGLYDALHDAVITRARPFMGICVGMQMLADRGYEYSETAGLGWIAGHVEKITPRDPQLKVPHMGWNDLQINGAHPVLTGLKTGDHAYFVHSYHFIVKNAAERLAHCDYAGAVTAIVGRDNIIAAQFHPEKSQGVGLNIIGNFLEWRP